MPSSFYISRLEVRLNGHLAFDGAANLTSGVNVLIGRNGSGKTTMLDMIRRAANDGGALPNDSAEEAGVISDTLASIAIVRADDPPTTVERRKGTNQWSGSESLRGKVRFVTSNRSLRNEMNVRSVFAGITPFALPDPGEELNVADEFNKAINAELLDRMRGVDGGLEAVTRDIESEYRAGLVDFDKDIRLDFARDNPVYFVDHRNRELTIQNLSSGEKEFLYFYSYLRRIRFQTDQIILIDEPELHLHSTQIRKLCELLDDLSKSNQVIVATHSSEVLQAFLRSGHIVLLSRGQMRPVDFPADLRELIDDLGVPVDPSVFTAHWIMAENRAGSQLPGPNGARTEEVLGWLFGLDINRRFWAFGSNRISAEISAELLAQGAPTSGDVKLSVLLDGDRLIRDPYRVPPTAVDVQAASPAVHYLPCWEVENLVLAPAVLGTLDASGGMEQALWRLATESRDRLVSSMAKTVVKAKVQEQLRLHRIDADPADELEALKSGLAAVAFDSAPTEADFETLIANRDWKWLPGKEMLGLLVNEYPELWNDLRRLGPEAIRAALQADPDVLGLTSAVLGATETVVAPPVP